MSLMSEYVYYGHKYPIFVEYREAWNPMQTDVKSNSTWVVDGRSQHNDAIDFVWHALYVVNMSMLYLIGMVPG